MLVPSFKNLKMKIPTKILLLVTGCVLIIYIYRLRLTIGYRKSNLVKKAVTNVTRNRIQLLQVNLMIFIISVNY